MNSYLAVNFVRLVNVKCSYTRCTSPIPDLNKAFSPSEFRLPRFRVLSSLILILPYRFPILASFTMADPAVVATWIAVVLIAALIVTASHRVERSEYLGHFFFFHFPRIFSPIISNALFFSFCLSTSSSYRSKGVETKISRGICWLRSSRHFSSPTGSQGWPLF